jgi:hypothetical protein
MNPAWPRPLSRILLLLLSPACLAGESTQKTDPLSVSPKVPEKSFSVPAIPSPPPPVLRQWTLPIAEPLEAAILLQAAAKDVRLLELWSLDPNFTGEDDKEHPGRLFRFHGFRTIGREELKKPEDVQKLLHAVILAITHGPEEASECFTPRHGLRIHGQKGFIDVIVCYECEQGSVHSGDKEIWFTTNKDAVLVLDLFFEKLGLHKAE